MLSQESQQLLAWSVNCQLFRQQVLILQHILEENLSKTTSLPRFVNVEVQDAWSIDVTSFAVFVEDVERFAADLKETNDEAAGFKRMKKKK